MRTVAATLVVLAVLYFCLFSRLDAIGLVGPDEPRYAWVARAMQESGDWVTPRLYDRPWLEKPPLYYWGAAAAFALFGENEVSARLPSAVAALLAVLALAWTARRQYGAAAAFVVLLIFPSSIGVLGFARGASTDMVFSSALALAMCAAAELVLRPTSSPSPARWAQAMLGIFLGAAVLAKGPAGVILAGGSVVCWALLTGQWRRAIRPLHPHVLVWFALTAMPWYVLCAQRNPEFVNVFLLAHNLQRYLTPVFRHEQPWWFFGPVLLLGLLPWTALLAGAVREAWRGWQQWRQSASAFFLCWAAFPLLFFSASQSKLPGYILPAVAPLALVMAASVSRSIENDRRTARWLLASAGGTMVVLVLTAGGWLERLPPESGLTEARELLPWLGIAAGAGVASLLLALAYRGRAALVVLALSLAGLVEVANRVVLPRLDPYLSARATARMLADDAALRASLHAYRLHRAWHYGLNFYLERELPQWNPTEPGPAWVVTSQEGLEEMRRQGRSIFALPAHSPRAVLVRAE
ncbi:MAG: glycosyltransferase family 39 protein [Acidobacteriia bacterium]|nr:glycosyltransferase family 39 protein [Terriglobia bacterium]